MFAGLLTDFQLVPQERIGGFRAVLKQGRCPLHVCTGLVIAPHQCVKQ